VTGAPAATGAPVSTTNDAAPADAVAFLRTHADWLFDPRLGTCIVGSQALAIACAEAGVAPPRPADLDLSWALDVDAGRRLLEQRGVSFPTTEGNQERGTLALKVGGHRIEVTTFRAGDTRLPLDQRIVADLQARDMTIGALAFHLASGAIVDPTGGLADWRGRRIVAVGDAAARVREHPVRWLRYYRKAHELGFELDRAVRKLTPTAEAFAGVPAEALGAELRAGLGRCRSPGRLFVDLHEAGLLAALAPELDRQFDGRPAGPQRWHPEIGQALHMVLALEWAVERCAHLDERDRMAVLLAVLCHDLGKGFTDPLQLPGHPGHERAGAAHVKRVLDRFPGLADQRTRMLALHVCELHVEIRHLRELRPGTMVALYDGYFRARDYPIGLFALAVGADSGGRLGMATDGDRIRARITADLLWLRQCCDRVDAAALRAKYPDVERFKAALHEARCRALAVTPAADANAAAAADGAGNRAGDAADRHRT